MILGYILLIIYILSLAAIFYSFAILPVLRDQTKFRLYKIRDDLRALAINGQIDPDTYAFRHLEGMLNVMVRQCVRHNVSNMMYFMLTNQISRDDFTEMDQFQKEAPEPLKAMEKEAMRRMFTVMLQNSVVFVMFAGVLLAVHKSFKSFVELKNRLLWHAGPPSTGCPHLAAR